MNIMLDLLETSDPCDKKEKSDVIFCDLVKLRRALNYSIEKEMAYEFIYSMVKFARNNSNLTIEEIISMSSMDLKS
ncbi:MAG: hypothetical protein EBS19_11680 [Spirochaetia bacterium]|nr:hypothetical protein [Spirochaetia bacterium]